MTVLVYLVPIALGLGLTGLLAFLWSLKSGQYQDMDGAALRILGDDDVSSAGDPVGDEAGRQNRDRQRARSSRL